MLKAYKCEYTKEIMVLVPKDPVFQIALSHIRPSYIKTKDGEQFLWWRLAVHLVFKLECASDIGENHIMRLLNEIISNYSSLSEEDKKNDKAAYFLETKLGDYNLGYPVILNDV